MRAAGYGLLTIICYLLPLGYCVLTAVHLLLPTYSCSLAAGCSVLDATLSDAKCCVLGIAASFTTDKCSLLTDACWSNWSK